MDLPRPRRLFVMARSSATSHLLKSRSVFTAQNISIPIFPPPPLYVRSGWETRSRLRLFASLAQSSRRQRLGVVLEAWNDFDEEPAGAPAHKAQHAAGDIRRVVIVPVPVAAHCAPDLGKSDRPINSVAPNVLGRQQDG
jgi:hypothetical protein